MGLAGLVRRCAQATRARCAVRGACENSRRGGHNQVEKPEGAASSWARIAARPNARRVLARVPLCRLTACPRSAYAARAAAAQVEAVAAVVAVRHDEAVAALERAQSAAKPAPYFPSLRNLLRNLPSARA